MNDETKRQLRENREAATALLDRAAKAGRQVIVIVGECAKAHATLSAANLDEAMFHLSELQRLKRRAIELDAEYRKLRAEE